MLFRIQFLQMSIVLVNNVACEQSGNKLRLSDLVETRLFVYIGIPKTTLLWEMQKSRRIYPPASMLTPS